MTDELDRELLRAVLQHVLDNGAFPAAPGFERKHAPDSGRLEELIARGLLKIVKNRYYLSLQGLHACQSKEADEQLEQCRTMLPKLQEAWRLRRGVFGDVEDLHDRLQASSEEHLVRYVDVPLGFLVASGLVIARLSDSTGLPFADIDLEGLLYIDGIDAYLAPPQPPTSPVDFTGIALRRVEISGYRPFVGFSGDLGDLTVIIGANAAGKSSLFDFLRFVGFAAQNPLPPEIDPRCAGRLVFHAGGEDRISFALTAGRRSPEPIHYEVEIHGPIGSPRVVRERLFLERPSEAGDPLILLDLRGGRGSVRDLDAGQQQPPWTVPPNELALRRAIAPNMPTLSRFQSFLTSWRFYGGFDTSPSAAVRRPAQIEEGPTLAEDGANLSAVLHWLMLEHRAAWEELESYLRATIPGFLSLGVKTRAKGMVIGVLREAGLEEELTLADLSDGTLRLLCWLALAVSPSGPRLMCLDEPEIGLHPRVLPILAGALQLAAAHAQILIATHSPQFLSQFALEDIAVMRKEEGRAVFVRPADSEALRREVEEIGGDVLARLFVSDELEVRS